MNSESRDASEEISVFCLSDVWNGAQVPRMVKLNNG